MRHGGKENLWALSNDYRVFFSADIAHDDDDDNKYYFT